MVDHLVDDLQPLDLEQIRSPLTSQVVGAQLRYFAAVDSTNRVARELAPEAWVNGMVVLTDYQQAGRGRQGRTWTAPPCTSMLLSVVLETPSSSRPLETVMIGALAVADAITSETGLAVTLKWPNDVLIHGRKVCGILTEGVNASGHRVILGIGVNGNFDPAAYAEIPASATSLQRVLGRPVHREAFLATLLNALDLWYCDLTHDPDEVFATWVSRLHTVGRQVTVSDRSGLWQGVATGVQRDGGLHVRDETGDVRTVYAADVSVRDAGDYTSAS